MPLTPKGKKIQAAMKKQYGSRKGVQVFNAAANKGTVKGVKKKAASAGTKRNRLDRLNLRRVVRRRARVELMKLATTLSQQ